MQIALVRDVSPAIAGCELTHLERSPIDLKVAEAEHEVYRELLRDLGCHLLRLPAETALPDSVFVEDTAVVLDELAFLTNPGAASRRAEVESIATVLAPYRDLVRCPSTARLDGGDVLVSGRRIYVGRSDRSDAAGAAALADAAQPFGYEVRAVPIRGCLHLKSAACRVAPGLLLIQPDWVDAACFEERTLAVNPAEPFAANALLVGDTVVYPAAFPRTAERLRDAGLAVTPVPAGELAKAEGGVTCCSLLFAADASGGDVPGSGPR